MLKDKRVFLRMREDKDHCSACCPGFRLGQKGAWCRIYDVALQQDESGYELVPEECQQNSNK